MSIVILPREKSCLEPKIKGRNTTEEEQRVSDGDGFVSESLTRSHNTHQEIMLYDLQRDTSQVILLKLRANTEFSSKSI